MLVEMQFNLNETNQSVTFSTMRVHPQSSLTSAEIIAIYSEITSRITYANIEAAYPSEGSNILSVYYNECYDYAEGVVTEQPPSISTATLTLSNSWADLDTFEID